jgi:hypothetical protein
MTAILIRTRSRDLKHAVSMTAKIYSLSRAVREAAVDVKAVQRRIWEAGDRAYEWYPAQASARARMLALSLTHADNPEPAEELDPSPE